MSDQRDRINSLLNLAQHPNTPQAEAESALAMASKLMQKHGLSESDVAGASQNTDNEDVAIERIDCGEQRARRKNIGCAAVEDHDARIAFIVCAVSDT